MRPELDFQRLLHTLAPLSLTWVVGSHLHGTASESSDLDRLTIYHDDLDPRRPFPYFPAVRHDPAGDHKLYSLSEFIRLLAKGNPNSVEVLYATPEGAGSPPTPAQTFIHYVLSELTPHAAHRGFYGASLGHASQVLKQTRAYSDGPIEALSREEAKRVAHAIRVARYATSFAEPRWAVGLSEDDVTLLRDVKYGRVGREAALQALTDDVLHLEWLYRESPACQGSSDTLIERANHLMVYGIEDLLGRQV